MRGEEKGGGTRGARYLIYIVSFSKELTIIEENLFLERSHFRLGEVFYYFLFFFHDDFNNLQISVSSTI